MAGVESGIAGGAVGGVLLLAVISEYAFAAPFQYSGLCEASGAAALDATHFAVASDESNTIRIYERGVPDPIDEVDLEDFTDADKSDLEGAVAVDGRVYWISSHSFNSSGEDKPKRKRFFATDVVAGIAGPTLVGAGVSRGDLRDALARAAGVQNSQVNIEGLAAGENGSLLVGFRGPQNNENAIVLEFANPAEVVGAHDAPATFTRRPEPLQIDGLGIRSIDLIGSSPSTYLVAAGAASDAPEFALYQWTPSSNAPPVRLDSSFIEGMRPEALFMVPGTNLVQVLSDDGSDQCSDETTPESDRRFRSVDVEIDR